MKIRQYQVDAFARRVFAGNPAAVCPLAAWLPDHLLQAIAEENNLAETAFFVPQDEGFHLRWFSPLAEVDLCGHATLAAAYVLFNCLGYGKAVVDFATRSGRLSVERRGGLLAMDFPAIAPTPCRPPVALIEGLGHCPLEVLAADDYLAVFASEDDVRALAPDVGKLGQLDRRGVIVTAPGVAADFVSRFFAPKLGVTEDAVTGSAHCELAPYWSSKLGKSRLKAVQVSRRGGEVGCEMNGERVTLLGSAVLFMTAEIEVDA